MRYGVAKKLNLEGPGAEAFELYRRIYANKAVQRITNFMEDELSTALTKTAAGYDISGSIFGLYDRFKKMLAKDKRECLELRVHSPGGDALEGLAVFNLIRMDGREFNTINMGMAASAASYIFAAGQKRHMGGGAMIMVHDAWGMGIGNADEMTAIAEMLDHISDSIASVYALVAGGSRTEWRNRMKAETWMNAADCLDCGMATSAMKKTQAKPANMGEEEEDEDPEEDPKDADEGDEDDDSDDPPPPEKDEGDEDEDEEESENRAHGITTIRVGNTLRRVVV